MATRAAALDSKHIASTWGAKPTDAGGSPTNVVITTGQLLRCVVIAVANISLSGTPTIQGVATAASDLILVAGQTTPSQNGVYRVAAAAWERVSVNAEDWCIAVVRGGDYPGVWLLENTATPDVGTDDITFVRLATVDELNAALNDHTAVVATATTLGHVKVDDVTVKLNGSNQLYAALSGSGSTDKIAKWSGASALGYSDAVSIGVGSGEISIDTLARRGMHIQQQGDYECLWIVRNGAGSATSYCVRIEAQDTTDGTAAVLITKAGPGAALAPVHLNGGVAAEAKTIGNATTTIMTVTEVEAESRGTPGVGFGIRQNILLASSDTLRRKASAQTVEWVTATDASRKARWKLLVSDTAERTAMIAEASGTAVLLGFFGAAAVAKPTALTAIDNSTVDTTYGTQERDVITNTRTRLSELETKLKNLGLLS